MSIMSFVDNGQLKLKHLQDFLRWLVSFSFNKINRPNILIVYILFSQIFFALSCHRIFIYVNAIYVHASCPVSFEIFEPSGNIKPRSNPVPVTSAI